MKSITVLVTGGGAPGISGTLHALKNNSEKREVRIVTVDAKDDVVGKYFSDSFYQVPKASDPNFLNVVLDICKKEKVDVILPQVTRELELFSKAKKHFREKGIEIVIAEPKSIEIANNKYELMKKFSSLGYNQGIFELISSKSQLYAFAQKIKYPINKFVIKPPSSNGMRGLRIVDSKKINLKDFLNEKPSGIKATLDEVATLFDNNNSLDIVAMEYFPGMEYSVDVYRSPISGKIVVIPRTRELIRTGITFEGELVNDGKIMEMSKKLAQSIGMEYCFGFQFKIGKDEKFHLLECNPRIQGTMIMSVLGGANIIYWAVKEALGEMVELDNVNVNWGMKFKRFWGGISIYNGKVKKILESD